ncbi:MAG: DUF3891 family protein [Planctomycetota bacterium]
MIRRNVPLGDHADGVPHDWLLVSQIEHARLSHVLASAWQGILPAAAEATRDEFLAAVLHHDDGWEDWRTAPKLDPEHGRPYGFTEMPPAEGQAIWAKSIDACCAIGPLAGWVVASHFIQLQSKRDDDFPEWAKWLGEQDRRRAGWFEAWQSQHPANTAAVAEECLHLLREFDWLSLWLCCRAPIDARDPVDALELGDGSHGFGPFLLTPKGPVIKVDPWPFTAPAIDLVVNAERCPAGVYRSASELNAVTTRAAWRLAPATGT